MAGQKQGLMSKMVIGSEKAEGYARAQLPSNRWELFWDIFKGRFSKLFIINILMLLFFIPVIALIFFRSNALFNYGIACPYTQPFGVGYQSAGNFIGYAETITANVNVTIYLFLPIACLIASIGLAGGAYVIRNMVWTEGVFVANDFWRGIKQNAKELLITSLIYSILLYSGLVSIAFANQALALGTGIRWLLIVSKVVVIVLLLFFTIVMLHIVSMCVTYKLKYMHLLRNAFLFAIGLLPQNIFFIALGAIPFIVYMLGGFFMAIGLCLIIVFGLSLFLLVWTDYCQWAYDQTINERIGEKTNKGIYEKIKGSDAGAIKKYKEQLETVGQSSFATRPIKPITDEELTVMELPTSFNRDDLTKLAESKKAIYDDHDKYVEEHYNDEQFVKAREMAKEKEWVDPEQEKRIAKAKKELGKRKKK